MFGLALDFAFVHGIKVDATATCTCCNCGKELLARHAYADSTGRAWCPHCVEGERISNLYEIAIHELTRYFDRLDIPYEEPERLHDGYAVRFPWCEGDVACHSYTYGGREGLMETYQFSMDDGDVNGYLHPLEALEIVLHDWNKRNKKMQEGE